MCATRMDKDLMAYCTCEFSSKVLSVVVYWLRMGMLILALWAQAPAMSGFLMGSTLWPRVELAKGVNEVTT